MIAFFIVAALAYAAASVAYGIEREGDEWLRRAGRILLALAGIGHFLCIGAQSAAGEHPFQSVFLVTSFGAMLTVLGFFAVSRGRPLAALGGLVAPVGLVGLVLGVLFGDVEAARAPASASLARLHIGLATAGLAGFLLAAGTAASYLAMERRLRARLFKPRPGAISLAGLDRLHHRLMLAVTPIFTLAIVTGVLWIVRAGGVETLRARWFELLTAAVAWLACVAILGLRAALGIRGRRAAGLTLIAFACMVAILAYYGVRT